MMLIAIVLFGAIFGSFLNVVIYRLPLGKSVVRPRSHCPHCERQVRAIENIPVVGYLWLRGKCRGCGAAIPVRYVLVEVLTPALLACAWWFSGPSWEFVRHAVLLLLLIPITFIDLSHKLILDRITLPGILLGLGLSIAGAPGEFLTPILGMLAGGGSLWAIAIAARAMYGQDALGGGDIKLGAMIGAFLSPGSILLALLLAYFTAAAFSISGMLAGKLDRRALIPFGPFIALGAVSVVFFQDEIVNAYINLIAG